MSDTKNKEKENDAIQFTSNIQSSFKGMKISMYVMAALCAVICIANAKISAGKVDAAARNIYVIDQGSVLQANRADNGEQRDLEAMDHVRRFHELFYNLSPNVNLINQNIERALNLADESAYDYFNDQKEANYYSRLIDINATQQISIDSIKVNILTYPYQAETYASLFVLRESNISYYTMRTTCTLTETERSSDNPHGLMIGNFYATKPEFQGTNRR